MAKKKTRRTNARFLFKKYSSAYRRDVEWEIVASNEGVTARRKEDGRRVSISWPLLIGAAMFYGCDSERERL